MTIKIKNMTKLEEEITLAGYTLVEFSKKIKKCRSFMYSVKKNRTLGPAAAKAISTILKQKFEVNFEITN